MDYEKLGFKCGIEIHQRLDTKKLFCDCSSSMEEKIGNKVMRKLRAVAGETGNVDPAVLYEFLRDKKFLYSCYSDESCEVELDEEPPHELRKEALEISLQVAKMLDCEVPDEIHPMRKTVIDGSNTTGFQRTMLVGMDGTLKTKEEVGIENVCLEEESAQILERSGNTVEYGLNRLGIPLVEIGTAPDIRSPEHARKTAEKIGKLLRATRKVQRGIGTIRQDINVSIAEGARVEVKGFQELEMIEEVVKKEVERQKNLIEIKEELDKRDSSVPDEVYDVKDCLENSSGFGKKLYKKKGVKAFVLEGFDGLLAREICGDKTFGKELAEYAMSHGLGGMIHTDEDLSNYGLEEEFKEIIERTGSDEEDLVVLMAGDDELENAIKAVKERAKEAKEGVPEETRDANQDGTTSYMRPLPGEARMYPETDVPSIRITEKRMDEIDVPKSLGDQLQELIEKYGLSEHLAREVMNSPYFDLFDRLTEELNLEASLIADSLTTTLKDLKKREGVDLTEVSENLMEDILKTLDEGKIPKDAVPKAIKKIVKGEGGLDEVIDELKAMSDEELESIVEDVLEDKEGLLEDERAFKKLMGPVMGKVRGRADGDRVSEMLKKKIEEKRG
ncbi:MAG: Glu-tRNA(Gln) amidotransferase subunit GatE [Candidatus Aenigmatarchaeota archaeon]